MMNLKFMNVMHRPVLAILSHDLHPGGAFYLPVDGLGGADVLGFFAK